MCELAGHQVRDGEVAEDVDDQLEWEIWEGKGRHWCGGCYRGIRLKWLISQV